MGPLQSLHPFPPELSGHKMSLYRESRSLQNKETMGELILEPAVDEAMGDSCSRAVLSGQLMVLTSFPSVPG